jgi:prolyl-tRNA editing enzyme YbaK/EbsC (Cys-tRNA(Pro) deacylase)
MYNDGNFVATAETAKTIAYVLEMYGFDGSVATSSSIDFADEYGFENYDDAKTLWGEGVKRFYMTNEVN